MKKNILILKRNIISTLFEILFPIILMILSYAIRKAFTLKTFEFSSQEGTIENYIQNKSVVNFDYSSMSFQDLNVSNPMIPTWAGLSILPALQICLGIHSKYQPRPLIATIGIPEKIKNKILVDSSPFLSRFNFTLTYNNFKDFKNIDELNDYVKDPQYGQDNFPLICFGMRYENVGHNYNYSLHYFDSVLSEGVTDIDNVKNGLFDRFQSGPDLDSYKLYQTSGYTYIMKLINEYILQKELKNDNAKIDFAMIPMPYMNYRSDPFSKAIGYMIPFFIIIAYMCPLCLYVYRMVGEKENKSKEGMKIMGLGEGTYFLSYFIQYVVITFVDSIINTIILAFIFTKIPFYYLFIILFLWTLDLFAMIFFFQSFIDKTRVALILSLLIYFATYFLSMACMDEGASKVLKIIMSILPPVCIELGIVLLGKFESHFKQFHPSDYTKIYTNYSIFIMNLMQFIDFFLYLFLGYYLQNVLPHEFGIKKPWYFLFTSEYWCENKNKNKNKVDNLEELRENEIQLNNNKNNMDNLEDLQKFGNQFGNIKKKHKNDLDSQNVKLKINNVNNDINTPVQDKNFEGEELYQDKTNPDDALRIKNIVKIFGDGKRAVDNVNLNFYKDEIFALLGHNGAGKTTLISMLTGLYEANSGTAYYDGYDILDSNNMDKFRTILGICPQHDVLFDDLTIREHLEMFCIFKGYTSDDIDSEINKTIHDFELDKIQNIIAKNLSAGQRRKLSIAISLIGGSKVIFLDEPSSGMDITSRRNLWDILKRQSEQKIIILTTHYMEEASVLGKRIGIINAGKMKCIGTPLFLIERFGKYMSLNINKEPDADNEKIVDFIKQRAVNLEYEILSEEIMFRIPKENYSMTNDEYLLLTENSDKGSHKIDEEATQMSKKNNNTDKGNLFDLTKFFEDLDNNLNILRIKSYSVSMPTLEDVFLNVAAEDTKLENQNMTKDHRKFSSPDIDNDKILFETNFRENYSSTGKSKFVNDFYACFNRRFLLTTRDVKGFLMEILCPILLCVIGLLVSQVDFQRASGKQYLDMGAIGKQDVLFGKLDDNINLDNYKFNITNVTNKYIDFDKTPNIKSNIYNYVLKVFDQVKDKEDSIEHEVDMMDEKYVGIYGSYLMLQDSNDQYKYVEVINSRVKHGVAIYTHFFLKKIIEKASPNVKIDYIHYPLPLTAQLEEQRDQANNMLVIFFIAIAFALIPANFITIIVKEKNNNSKHLMRVSGINIAAYWLVNYIFELVKYYFTCGVCLLLLWAFSFYRKYLYILYLCNGPAIVSITYILSFLFDSESGAQNGIILLNFLLGALGSVVILLLRALDNVKTLAKVIEYIIGLLPSFCFNFGYSLLLNKIMIYAIDYPNKWYSFKDDEVLKHFNLLLSMIIYLSVESVLYTLILVIIEWLSYYSFFEIKDTKMDTNINDSQVLKEIERANEESDTIGVTNDNGETNKIEYSVRIKNLQKIYSMGCCQEPLTAIKNMSFCVEPGECFGLLGLNGAGKTTTFKCITQEILPNNGKIFINGKDMKNNFSELSSVFGYCPQFDAIFEYMSVYENLEFYGKIKGIRSDYLDKVVKAMIEEMSLSEFTNKIAGRLSGGNKRKLSVAISFLCSPPIVLLDEPSTGMDPEARRFMWSVIHKISTKGKKASVIMTTHSMDEAETLCKRMAIMVNGEFVCLGKAGEIKEKYGYGYEIEVRIKPLSERKFEKIIKLNDFDKNMKINMDNIEEVLTKLGDKIFINELVKGRFGSKIIRDIQINNGIPLRSLISWTFFVKNAIKFIKKAKSYFELIILTEHIDNNFLFKMKKNKETKSIGFFFGLFESNKDNCYVTEYSIHQTSLEQIFYKFEAEKGKSNLNGNGKDNENNEDNKKEEIIINDEIFNSFLK